MIYIKLLTNDEFIYEGDSIENMETDKLHRVFSRFTELSGPEAEQFSEEDLKHMRAVEYGFDLFNGGRNAYPLKSVTFASVLYWGPLIETQMISHVFNNYKESLINQPME